MKIHIANISAKLEESALMQLFVQYGQVSSLKIDKDKQSGQRKNTGFVEMRVAEQAG
jgi:RNA recognition motif-containing protein